MRKTITLFILMTLLFIFSIRTMAAPWHFGNGEQIIEKNKVIRGDLIFQGERLEIDGRIQGDLLVMAGEVVINGQVDGSVLGTVYQKITLDGSVGQNLRVIAGEVEINGKVNGSFTGIAYTYNASSVSVVKGIWGTFTQWKSTGVIDGPVDMTSQSPAKFGGRILGDVKLKGAPPEWSVPLEVGGKFTDYTVPSNPPKDKRITIKGGYSHRQQSAESGIVEKSIFLVRIVWFIGSLLICLIFFRLFPRTALKMTEPSARNFKRSLLIGLITLIGVPIVLFLLSFTIVGIPLVILLGAFYVLILMFSNIPIFLWLGRLAFPQLKPTLVILLGGLFVLCTGLFPAPIEAVVGLFLSCLGFGMIFGNVTFQIHET